MIFERLLVKLGVSAYEHKDVVVALNIIQGSQITANINAAKIRKIAAQLVIIEYGIVGIFKKKLKSLL